MPKVAARDAFVISVVVAAVGFLVLIVFTALMIDSVVDYFHHIRQC